MIFYDPQKAKELVFVFALSTCNHCREAKKLLTKLKVSYRQVEVDLLTPMEKEAALAEMSRYNPAQSFPTLIIGSRVVVGNLPDDIQQASIRLKKSQ
ncbi:MAG: hypothetical protein AMR96_01330 [Candidatus Adiutrix intracellularis]|nr:MAG: hypothetical protein AMR96_01330 [Candidatus Adiutrix intracellularis]